SGNRGPRSAPPAAPSSSDPATSAHPTQSRATPSSTAPEPATSAPHTARSITSDAGREAARFASEPSATPTSPRDPSSPTAPLEVSASASRSSSASDAARAVDADASPTTASRLPLVGRQSAGGTTPSESGANHEEHDHGRIGA